MSRRPSGTCKRRTADDTRVFIKMSPRGHTTLPMEVDKHILYTKPTAHVARGFHARSCFVLLMYQNLALTAEVLDGPREHHRAARGIGGPSNRQLFSERGQAFSTASVARIRSLDEFSQRYGPRLFFHRTGVFFFTSSAEPGEDFTRLRGCQKSGFRSRGTEGVGCPCFFL